RRLPRLGLVRLGHVRDQPGAGLLAAHQHDAQRLAIDRGRAVLDEVVDSLDLLVGHRLVGEGVGGAGLPEQQVLGLRSEGESGPGHRRGGHGYSSNSSNSNIARGTRYRRFQFEQPAGLPWLTWLPTSV